MSMINFHSHKLLVCISTNSSAGQICYRRNGSHQSVVTKLQQVSLYWEKLTEAAALTSSLGTIFHRHSSFCLRKYNYQSAAYQIQS